MRRIVAGFLAGLMLFTPTFQVVGGEIGIEVRGNLYDKLPLPMPKGDGPKDITLFEGQFGVGLTPPVGACGMNAAFSFLGGLKYAENLGQLKEFINDWASSATALALYGLATYLPIAKEVLLGANLLSNFVAQLRGFSCSQVMETIKEFNYQDSFLIKKCIAKKLKKTEDEVDLMKAGGNIEEWYKAYKKCLNSTTVLDLFDGDKIEVEKYLSRISPRRLARCYLGVKDEPTPKDIVNADLQTRAKYFLYMILPDITLSVGVLKIGTAEIVDTRTGQRRPATLVDVVNIHTEDFEKNFDELIKNLKGVIKYEMDYEDALKATEGYIKDFERKYGITAEDLAGILILTLKMRDFMERKITANGKVDDKVLRLALMPIDNVLSDIKEHFRYRVIERLKLAMHENSLRLKQAEELRKAVGSVATPGGRDDCLTNVSASQ